MSRIRDLEDQLLAQIKEEGIEVKEPDLEKAFQKALDEVTVKPSKSNGKYAAPMEVLAVHPGGLDADREEGEWY